MRKKVENRILQCYICKTIVKNKVSNLRRHMQLHDPNVDRLKCTECGSTFQNKENLKTHWNRQKHAGEIKFQTIKSSANGE